MHSKSHPAGWIISILLIFSGHILQAQSVHDKIESSLFSSAKVAMDQSGRIAKEIRFNEGDKVSCDAFMIEYFRVFEFSKDNEARTLRVETDKIGFRHLRYQQFYKGIEVAEVQLLVHEKNQGVYLAHGNFIPGINLDVRPTLTESDAFRLALKYYGPGTYPEKPPRGKLMLSAASEKMIAEEVHLVYRFDIQRLVPYSRDYVDIDAHTGELVKKLSIFNYDDIQTQGISQYYDTVSITISDENYTHYELYSAWHPDDWNAYDPGGFSWWVADTLIGSEGGYDNAWYYLLETDSIVLTGTDPVLSFYHRYSVETPAGAPVLYYGWDGMNVRISNDEGETWQVLQNPVPAYTCNSLYGFGNVHGEGDHIPGWSGLQSNWQHVSINLSSYTNDTIMIRFAFASDGGYCTSDNHEMFGWQVDDILVSSSSGNLFENNGSLTGMKSHSAFSEVNIIEGKYRLREDARCGIATYNALNHTSYSNAIDFVEEDSIFSADTNMCGVTLHYALEKTYDYYLNIHGRHSFDDTDNRILGYANWIFDYGTSQDPNNAMWNGSFTCFGTGDGWQFGPWGSIDIAGHEFTHGVTQYSAGLLYQNEPGALNESFSDIFGTGVEFFTGDGDWLCGEDICMSLPCLRSMENPKSRNNPDTYRGTYWVSTSSTPAQSNDFNGVHTNCGVQNFWFYLTSVGGMGDNDLGDPFSITGIGISDAEQIAYRNLTVYLTPTSEYDEAVLYSLQSAEDLFGTGSTQYNTVMDAWYAVGLSFSPKIRIPEYLRITVNESNPGSGSINIRSIGLTTLSVTDLEIEGDGFSITNMPSLPLELENDESYALNITFAPESIGTTNGSFMISSNDPDYPDKTITLEGINIVDALDQISICTEQDTRIYSSPNPFVSTTQINYCLNQSSDVMVKIYNLDGKEILTLVDASQTSGEYSVIWEGNDFTGTQVYPGIYFCILQTNDEFIVTKMMLNQ